MVSLAGRLAAPDDRFSDWAKAVGVEYGPLETEEEQEMTNKLEAAVAHLYGLSETQLQHIFSTHRQGYDNKEISEITIRYYKKLEGDYE